MTAENQRENVKVAARSLAEIARKGHELVIAHGNGPQVGLLALQGAAYKPDEMYPLDVLGAETEGMIGYLIEQELGNLLPPDQAFATLLTQVEVDRNDPAFKHPSKPIGPVYEKEEAERLAAERGWAIAPDGEKYRRVVPSPRPKRIFEIRVINLLVSQDVIVICAGGGGIPTMYREDGSLVGVEAVIDKDRASALLARELEADALILLTDVEAVFKDWDTQRATPIKRVTPSALAELSFAAGSMGPKVEAACEFVEKTGGIAGIGRLKDALAIVEGRAGTLVASAAASIPNKTQ